MCCSSNGTIVSQLTAYDDDNDTLTFTLIDDSAGPFSLTSSGTLYVDTSKGWLSYESRSSYTIAVSVRETVNQVAGSPLLFAVQGNLTGSIFIRDLREAPVFVFSPGQYRVDEESLYPSVVTPYVNGSYIVVADQDAGNNSALVVSVVTSFQGVVGSYFEAVNASDGSACRGGHQCVLRVRSGSPRLNYDSPMSMRSLLVNVTVTDSTGLATALSPFSVTVVDVNQGMVHARGNAVWLRCIIRSEHRVGR